MIGRPARRYEPSDLWAQAGNQLAWTKRRVRMQPSTRLVQCGMWCRSIGPSGLCFGTTGWLPLPCVPEAADVVSGFTTRRRGEGSAVCRRAARSPGAADLRAARGNDEARTAYVVSVFQEAPPQADP